MPITLEGFLTDGCERDEEKNYWIGKGKRTDDHEDSGVISFYFTGDLYAAKHHISDVDSWVWSNIESISWHVCKELAVV